jgi:hypothetical protein
MNLTPVFAIFGLWNCAEHDHDLAPAMRIFMLQCSNPLKLTSEGVSFNQKNPLLMAVSSTPITKLLILFSASYDAYLKFVRRIIRNKCRTLIIPILWHTAKRRQQPETVSQSSISDARLGEIAQMTLLAAKEIQRFRFATKSCAAITFAHGLINMSALTSVHVQRAREA